MIESPIEIFACRIRRTLVGNTGGTILLRGGCGASVSKFRRELQDNRHGAVLPQQVFERSAEVGLFVAIFHNHRRIEA